MTWTLIIMYVICVVIFFILIRKLDEYQPIPIEKISSGEVTIEQMKEQNLKQAKVFKQIMIFAFIALVIQLLSIVNMFV